MQEQVNVRPMVDVLSEITGKTVVMSGSTAYVYLDTKAQVEPDFLNQAVIKRDQEKAEAEKEAVVKEFTGYADEHIQSKVIEYNKANSTMFKDVHSCANYRHDTEYTHKPFCAAVWAWNVAVWEYIRAEQDKVFAGARTLPATKEDAIAELPVFVFGG